MATRYPGDHGRLQALSVVEEGGDKRINMAYLAIIVCLILSILEYNDRF